MNDDLSDRNWRPVPDPTLLTTQQLLREIFGLRELLESKLAGMDEKFSTRLNAMDKALELIQVAADRVPSDVDLKVGQLQELQAERFKTIEVQIKERDIRDEQYRRDNQAALTAALLAEEKASVKTEAGFEKQIGQLGELIKANQDGMSAKIDASKERLDRLEGQTIGATGSWTAVTTAVGLGLLFISVAAAVIGVVVGTS